MSRSYLDHAATTVMRPEAIEAMTGQLARVGNPSSLHASGRAARRVVEESRERIAVCLGARPSEVIFTSGGTEADNLAVIGGLRARRAADPARRVVITSAIEHPAIAEACGWLAASGEADVITAGVDEIGLVDWDQLAAAIDDHGPGTAAVVSIMWANNEVGTVQPVESIAELAHRAGAWAHTDAVQACGHLPIDFGSSALDLLSIAGHKIGGPAGIGVLLARRDVDPAPVEYGGGQERGIRSGTVDVAGVAGLAAAIEAASRDLADQNRIRALRDRLVGTAVATLDGCRLNGTLDPDRSLPTIANLHFAGCLADDLLMLLDRAGIDASTGSACTAGVVEPSEVLLAMGRDLVAARSALRFSLGWTSTDADVDSLLAALPEAMAAARRARAVG